jgi:hypothetical protein
MKAGRGSGGATTKTMSTFGVGRSRSARFRLVPSGKATDSDGDGMGLVRMSLVAEGPEAFSEQSSLRSVRVEDLAGAHGDWDQVFVRTRDWADPNTCEEVTLQPRP